MLMDSQKCLIVMDDRGVISLGGDDVRDFLQNLITQDIATLEPGHGAWAALLSPQGKYLFDFFVVAMNDGSLMLDCEASRVSDLIARLETYKLRADVEITDASTPWTVAALLGTEADSRALVGFEGRGGPFGGGVCYVDPRFGAIGARALLPRPALAALLGAGFEEQDRDAYDHARICLGLPDGARDLAIDKALPLENGLDVLNAINWEKGCYVGQELTARMRYRATVKRRLLPVAIEGDAPKPGTLIMLGDKEAGEMRSSFEDIGLALLRLDPLATLHEKGGVLTAGDTTLSPLRPPWMTASSEEPPIG